MLHASGGQCNEIGRCRPRFVWGVALRGDGSGDGPLEFRSVWVYPGKSRLKLLPCILSLGPAS